MAGERWTPGLHSVERVDHLGSVAFGLRADDGDLIALGCLRPDAVLFAAAPDLYAACLPLANADPDNPPPGVPVEDWRGAVLAARAAMAKARGEG